MKYNYDEIFRVDFSSIKLNSDWDLDSEGKDEWTDQIMINQGCCGDTKYLTLNNEGIELTQQRIKKMIKSLEDTLIKLEGLKD